MKIKKHAVVDQKKCVACGECAFTCRKKAIRIIDGCFASADIEICVGCGLCSKSCPAECITIVEKEVS